MGWKMSIVTIDSGTRKARKQHICDWCVEVIEIGEDYYFDDVIDETAGEWHHTKLHDECNDAWNETLDDNPDCHEQLCEELLSYAGRKRGQKFEG